MIKVVFKEKYGKVGDMEYTYSAGDIEEISVGDEVLVNTRYGLALAIVTQVDVIDDRFDEDELATVVSIAESAEKKKRKADAAAAKEKLMKNLIKNAKREKMLNEIRLTVNAEDYEKYIVNMTFEELEELYKAL